MDLLPEFDSRPSVFALVLVFFAGIGLNLVAYGAYLIPAASRLSVSGASVVLVGYAVVGFAVKPSINHREPAVLRIATWGGLAAAFVFTAEVCLEYVLLPKNNAPWGYVEFGLALSVYLLTAVWLTLKQTALHSTILGAVLTAMFSSVIWCVVVLSTFYLFRGTARQEQVLLAEGDYEDFARSGMHDFQAFIMEDFFGATFFHLLLGPACAAILAMLADLAIRGMRAALDHVRVK